MTDELTAVLEEIVEEQPPAAKKKGEQVTMIDESNLMVGERPYRLVVNHREGFDADRLGERYSDVLSRYDYIVGDWGYEQLRLKGFFRADNRRAHPDQRIDALEDYLYEYCNFGCAYFVIERTGAKKERHNQRRKRKRPTQQAHVDEKKKSTTTKVRPVIRKHQETTKQTTSNKKHIENKPNDTNAQKNNFVIRQREE
ncbi:MAG: YutD family protein [Enterococcus sp.]